MRNKQIQYGKQNNEDRFNKPNAQRTGQPRTYEAIKARIETNNREQDNRKHNSPDMNKFRSAADNTKSPYNIVRKLKSNVENDDKESIRFQKKDREDAQYPRQRPAKSKELQRNSSSPTLVAEDRKVQEEENQQYLKLHEKLNFIQSKIADMKRNVQRKREEKQQLLEARRRREQQREQQRKANEQQPQKKIDLKQFVTQVPEHKELHTFEQNPYSPKHNIYYISEIIKSYKDDKSLAREHLLTSLHILKILENSKFATDEEMRQRQVQLPIREGYQGRKTVIFDLDETLIHCNDTLVPPFDVKLPITFPTGEVIEAGINIRPHAQEIVKNLSQYFEVIVFTASHSCYANVVLDYLDPQGKYIQHRLFREHCYQTPEGMYCKDLRDMVLVDNAAYSYATQLDNGIPILPYYHGKTDFELKALERFLMGMVMIKDVRTLNRNTFQLHRYRNYYNQAERLVQEIYIDEQEHV